MAYVPAELRATVRARAAERCEYCHQRQADEPFLRYHIEHVIAIQHGGPTTAGNLALACHHCNLHKGPNLTGVDPADGSVVRLFDPRADRWAEHFGVVQARLVGLTPTGRATARVLAMNAPARVELRGLCPPDP